MDDGYQIKEELKKIPVEVEGDRYNWWYVCSECHSAINPHQEKCPCCGNFLSWDN